MNLVPQLAERKSSTAGYLSGGEQQMLAIGRALMQTQRSSSSTSPHWVWLRSWFRRYGTPSSRSTSRGLGVLLIEQNAKLALSIAHHGYIMETGKMVMDGPPLKLLKDEMQQNPNVIKAYLGEELEAEAVSSPLPEQTP